MKKRLIAIIFTVLVLIISYFVFCMMKYTIFELIAYFLIGISLVVLVLLLIPALLSKFLEKFNIPKSIKTAVNLWITLFCIAFVISPLWPYYTVGFDSWNGFVETMLSLPFYALSFIALCSIPIIYLKRKYPMLLKFLILLVVCLILGILTANIITKIQTDNLQKNIPTKNEQTLEQLNKMNNHSNKNSTEGYSTYTLNF